jgi:hypothetical protein
VSLSALVMLALLGGRPSGDAENAAVLIHTKTETTNTYCSGHILAPKLAVTARHCILAKAAPLCNDDGSLRDPANPPDMTPAPTDAIEVLVGAQKASARSIGVGRTLTPLDPNFCRADLAFLVLDESGLDVRVPIRRERVRVGEEFLVSGWGKTSDDGPAVPASRSTLEHVPISAVGPGRIAPGTFATGGNSMCFGDSGAVATIDGAVVGIYSRIDSLRDKCAVDDALNIFTAIASNQELTTRAYAAIGESPRYADDEDAGAPPPALREAGTEAPAPPPADTSSCQAHAIRHESMSLAPLVLVLLASRRLRSRSCSS